MLEFLFCILMFSLVGLFGWIIGGIVLLIEKIRERIELNRIRKSFRRRYFV